MVALKTLQPGNQPHRGKRRKGGECHALAAGALANLPHRAIDALQRRCDGAQQNTTGRGEFHRTRVAMKQGNAHIFFQALYLSAHSGLREGQFLRGRPEVQVARHRFKSTQLTGRDRP